MTNEDLLICECEDVDHSMVVRWDDDDEFVYVNIHLKPLPFFERLTNAINYLLGKRSRYGDFDEFILRVEDLPKVEKIVEFLKKQKIVRK